MTEPRFLDIAGARLEYVRLPAQRSGAPPLVLLHEGLGSVAMWRDFPQRLATATGAEVIAYSRRSYGRSSRITQPHSVDYMRIEARVYLDGLIAALGLQRPVLVGHSDGASIALIHAAEKPEAPSGVVLLAPHVFVEDITVTSIAAAKEAYRTTDLRARLGRYHDDVDNAFWGWNDIWLLPAFRQWNIEACVDQVKAPILAIQGRDDEYGTAAQVEAIQARAKAPCEIVLLPDCKHSPHRDQPERTSALIAGFMTQRAGA